MDCVTGRSIAYVATLVCAPLFHASRALTHCLPTQVYFSLSSSESNQKAGGAFELSAMYWQVVRLLENEPGLKEEAGEILLWWNQYVFFHIVWSAFINIRYRQIFPSKSAGKHVTQKSDDSIARLRAQKAAKKAAALQDATNHEQQ
jgi:hypothetical protein